MVTTSVNEAVQEAVFVVEREVYEKIESRYDDDDATRFIFDSRSIAFQFQTQAGMERCTLSVQVDTNLCSGRGKWRCPAIGLDYDVWTRVS